MQKLMRERIILCTLASVILCFALLHYASLLHNVATGKAADTRAQLQTPDLATIPPGTYFVTHVIDGDTIDVVDRTGTTERVRLLGINTPETVDPRRAVQCFGHEASVYTRVLLEGQIVILAPDPSQDARDKYNRILRYVLLNGVNVNLALIRDGYAYEYTYQRAYQYQQQFRAAEAAARVDQRGLWADDSCKGRNRQHKTKTYT